jgi:hypothetical protein
MNRIFTLIFCNILLLACSHKKGPVIFYNNRIINLGNIEFNKAFSGKIMIKNIGDEPLEILNVTADCSCTVPEAGNKKILSNDTTYIHFILTPAQDGFIQQSIYVDNTSVNESRVLFLIRAKVNLLDK